jgi:hypothetical protein
MAQFTVKRLNHAVLYVRDALRAAQFYQDVLGIQLQFAPRTDSLTLNSALHLIGQPLLPAAIAVLVIAVVACLVLVRKPRTYGELLTGTAVLTIASLLVAKWAYFNYYYIAAVLLAFGVAADGLPLDVPEEVRPPALLQRVWRLVSTRRGLQPSPT